MSKQTLKELFAEMRRDYALAQSEAVERTRLEKLLGPLPTPEEVRQKVRETKELDRGMER